MCIGFSRELQYDGRQGENHNIVTRCESKNGRQQRKQGQAQNVGILGRKCRLGELVCNVHETLRVLCRGTHIRKRHKQDHDGVGDKVARAGFVHGPRRSALSQNTSNDHNPGNAGRSNEEKNDQNRSCRIVQKDRGLLGFGRDANGNNHKDTGQNETQQENNGSHRPLHFQG